MIQQEIFINCGLQETRVAILENKQLEEFYIERAGTPRIVGNIYKGVVDSILPGMGSAFVNLGLERNGFLYVSDVIAPTLTYDSMLEDVEEEVKEFEPRHRQTAPIKDLLKRQDEILVQVVKGPIGTKGPRLTTHLSIPGHFVVLMPFSSTVGISKRIEERAERDRIRKILEEMRLPKNLGLIVRTAALGVERSELIREVKYLMRLWARIRERAKRSKPPCPVYEEYNIVLRVARDLITSNVGRIEIDSKPEFRQQIHFLNSFSQRLRSKIRLYRDTIPLFEHYDIERQIEQIYDRNVKLKCGGYIVIEETEGLVAIDINSGRFVGKRNLEETVFKTNLEAAEETARQIRLRDLGGIIVIDFIDMESPEHRRSVLKTFEAALERDRAKAKILNFSSLGVVEMSRQRMRKSLAGVIYQDCPYCSGRGLVKSVPTVSIELMRRLDRFFGERTILAKEVFIVANPEVSQYLLQPEKRIIPYLEKRFRKRIRVIENPSLHVEDVRIEEKIT